MYNRSFTPPHNSTHPLSSLRWYLIPDNLENGMTGCKPIHPGATHRIFSYICYIPILSMYKIIVLTVVFCFSGLITTFSQNYLVIDTNQINLQVSQINQTLSCGYPWGVYYMFIDIDDDGLNDFVFHSACDMGSWGSEAEINIASLSNNLFAIDTLVIDSIQYSSPLSYVVDTFELVDKFEYGDTVFNIEPYTSYQTWLVYHINVFGIGEQPFCLNLDNWIGGENYIGIKKIIDDVEYLGWIKVEVVSDSKIIVKDAAIYNPSLNLNHLKEQSLKIYPIPATDVINVDLIGFDKVLIYNITGKVMMDYSFTSNQKHQTFNISSLSSGLYLLRLIENDKIVNYKLVKE